MRCRWWAIALLLAGCGTASDGALVGIPAGDSLPVVAEIAVSASLSQHDQVVRGGIVFLCSWDVGLQLYDVGGGGKGGTPSNPQFISRIITKGGQVHNAWWFWAPSGEKRYVFVGQESPGSVPTTSAGDIHVVDVSDMVHPVEVAQYHLAGAGDHNFWVDESAQILYAAYYNGGVVALDISGTLSGDLSGRLLSSIQPGGQGNTYTWGVMLSGGSIYASDMASGLWQLKLVNGTLKAVGGGNNVRERYTSDLWVTGTHAYTGTWGFRSHAGNALKIWRLTGTGAPALVDSIVVAGVTVISDVEVSADGRMLMFSTQFGPGSGIYFYSLVQDPSRPTPIAYFPVTGNNQNGIHTATFADINGRRYVFAAKYPPRGGSGGPFDSSMLVIDVTGISP